MNKKNTKRSLGLSLLCLLLCASMLIGSTFAWFTDNASTAVNTIQAGTLKLKLEMSKDGGKTWEDAEGKTLDFLKAANAPAGEQILWEPGVTYELPQLRITNDGDLHLKYKVVINGINGSAKLNEVIDWTYNGFDVTTEAALAPKASQVITIKGHMQEAAGNDYQGETITGIGITVMATQNTVENDSYDNTYDENATIVAANNQEELNNAIAGTTGPTTVVLPAGNYTLPTVGDKDVTFTGTKDTVIDTTEAMPSTTGANITFDGVTVNFKEGGTYGTNGFTHSDNVVYENCTINGTQFLYADATFTNCTFNVTGDAYAVWTYGAKNVTFTNCTFNTSGKAVLVYIEGEIHGTVTVNGCTFNTEGDGYRKAAVEVGSSPNSADTTYNIVIKNSNADAGFTANMSTSNLWGNKNSMDKDHLNVTVDGNDVY